MSRAHHAIVGLAVLWLLAGAVPLLGASAAGAPAAAAGRQRLVHRFDFEERQLGNFEDLPMRWQRMGRPAVTTDTDFARYPLHAEMVRRYGFPAFTEVRFDQSQRVSGGYSFYLGLNGGNAGAFLEVGVLPANPGSDYRIAAMVRTTALHSARTRLVAYLIDKAGRRIDASVVATPDLVTSERWVPVQVLLMGDHPSAAWIGLQLEVVQPQPDGATPLGKHQVVYQDVRGGAWFDDITIWQVPRTRVSTSSPLNLVRAPDRPTLRLQVHDVAGQNLIAEVVLYDHRLQPVVRGQRAVGAGQPADWSWTPELPRYGWYLVELSVRDAPEADGSAGALVAQDRGALLYLPAERPMVFSEAARFQLGAEDVPEDQLHLVPAILEQMRLAAVVLSCWERQTTKATLEQRQTRLDAIAQTLMSRGRQVTLSLNPLPSELASALDAATHDPLAVFRAPKDVWAPYLVPVLMRHGENVRRWQLGSPDHAHAFFLRDLSPLFHMVQREFRELAPQPRLVLPWRLDQSRRSDLAADPAFAMSMPIAVRPEFLAQHLEEWGAGRGAPPAEISLTLNSPRPAELSHADRIDDLTLRMIHAWEAGVGQLTIHRPWVAVGQRDPTLAPDPLLGVFSQVAHRLAGRQVVGRLNLGNGLECMILSTPQGVRRDASESAASAASLGASGAGTLVAWNRFAPDDEAFIDMFLGPNPQVVDVWGNRQDVPLTNGRHRVKLGRTPVFIEGIDPALALFRAAFRIEPRFIESTQTPHACTVTLTNPWPRTINGSMLILEPKSWRIEPRRSVFSMSAGQTLSLPVEATFPVAEVAGRKKVVARFELMTDRRDVIELTTDLELGLRDVSFDATLGLESDAQTRRLDAVATLLITNTGDKPLALYAFANLPGYPRQERIVPRLLPGQSTVRRFRFTDAAAKLQAADLRVGLRETAGPAVLNKVLSVRR